MLVTAFVLTLIGAALAVGLELLEALAIVLAVGSTRRWRDAVIGAAGAVVLLAVAVVVVGPLLLARLPLEPLQVVIGDGAAAVRARVAAQGRAAAGRAARSPSYSFQEYLEEREAMEALPPPAPGQPDWPARIVAGKGVLLEGRRGRADRRRARRRARTGSRRRSPARRVAVVAGRSRSASCCTGRWRGCRSRTSSTRSGSCSRASACSSSARGSASSGRGGDAALLYIAATLLVVSQVQIAALAREPVAA